MKHKAYITLFFVFISLSLPTQASFWKNTKDLAKKALNNKHVQKICTIAGATSIFHFLQREKSKEKTGIIAGVLTTNAYGESIANQISKKLHPNSKKSQDKTKNQLTGIINALKLLGFGYTIGSELKKITQSSANKKPIFEIITDNKRPSDYTSVPQKIFKTVDRYIKHFTLEDKVGLVAPRSFIILHGPGGTGKTSIMERCSHLCRKGLKKKGTKSVAIKVNASLFSEKYYGMAPQKIYELLYGITKPFLDKNIHVQMLLDEAEGLLTNGKKESDEQGRVLNIFKKATTEFDKLSEAINKGALFIWGTTNNIEKIPQEIKDSRSLSVKIGNPDENSRYSGFINILRKKINIYKHIPNLRSYLRFLAKNTEGENFRTIKKDYVPELFQAPIFYNDNKNKAEEAKKLYEKKINISNPNFNKKIQWFCDLQKNINIPILKLNKTTCEQYKNFTNNGSNDMVQLSNTLKITALQNPTNQKSKKLNKKLKTELSKTDLSKDDTKTFIFNTVSQIIYGLYKSVKLKKDNLNQNKTTCEQLKNFINNDSKNIAQLSNTLKITARLIPTKKQNAKLRTELNKTNLSNESIKTFIFNTVSQIIYELYKAEYIKNKSAKLKKDDLNQNTIINTLNQYKNNNTLLKETLKNKFIVIPKGHNIKNKTNVKQPYFNQPKKPLSAQKKQFKNKKNKNRLNQPKNKNH